jgi:hypothetical protein
MRRRGPAVAVRAEHTPSFDPSNSQELKSTVNRYVPPTALQSWVSGTYY